MDKYRVLVLTDHTLHSDQNSLYAILDQMSVHDRCMHIDIASRGLDVNGGFFYRMQKYKLWGTRVDSDFGYTKDGMRYGRNLVLLKPEDYDIILMRLPRPVEDEFLDWLEEVFSKATFINKPRGIKITSSKEYLLKLSDVCPDIKLCKSIDEVLSQTAKYPIVLKPLKEYGGKGLLRINGDVLDDGVKEYPTMDYLKSIETFLNTEGLLAMKFLKNVSEGDKRILVVGGEILAASLRIPAKDSWLCNVAQGGTSVPAEVSQREKKIIQLINPKLKAEGILIYGADTLTADNGERVLSEVNTLSIGGFPQAEAQTGRPIIKLLLNKIFEYADERRN